MTYEKKFPFNDSSFSVKDLVALYRFNGEWTYITRPDQKADLFTYHRTLQTLTTTEQQQQLYKDLDQQFNQPTANPSSDESTKILDSIKEFQNSDNTDVIPRIGTSHLHLESGTFRLSLIKDIVLDTNYTDPLYRITFLPLDLPLKEISVRSSELPTQLFENLKKRLRNEKINKVVQSVVLAMNDLNDKVKNNTHLHKYPKIVQQHINDIKKFASLCDPLTEFEKLQKLIDSCLLCQQNKNSVEPALIIKYLDNVVKQLCPFPSAIQSSLDGLKDLTKNQLLFTVICDLIDNYIKVPRNQEELRKLDNLIAACYGLSVNTKDDFFKLERYEDLVEKSGLNELSTVDSLFWTGEAVVKYRSIIGWNLRGIFTKGESGKIERSKFSQSMAKAFSDKNNPKRRRLVRYLESDDIEIPCITGTHIHLDYCSFPLKYINDLDEYGWLNFVDEFPISTSFVKDFITPFIREKLNYAIKLYSRLRDERLSVPEDKLLNDIKDDFNLLLLHTPTPLTPSVESTPPTPSTPSVESICCKSFTCQKFIQRDERALLSFVELYQLFVESVSQIEGYDKSKCHSLLFESDGKLILWITVDGMTQAQLEDAYPKQINFFSDYKFTHEPHVSPSMLKNAKPFPHNCVHIKNSASFFIHGDSNSNWEQLYSLLGKGARTLMFESRQKGWFPGRTLYVVADDIGASLTVDTFLESIGKNREFIIPPDYSIKMIESIVPNDHNDPQLLKDFENF